MQEEERARNSVQREREKEVVASVVTAACGEDREHEVVASVNSLFCTFIHSDSLQPVGCRGFSLSLGFST